MDDESSKRKDHDVIRWDLDKHDIRPHDLKIWLEEELPFCNYGCHKESLEPQTDIFAVPGGPSDNENVENKNAFERFLRSHLDNPEYKNKFAAFVNGKFQAIGDKRNALIDEMYDKFGNVDMYVDRVTDHKQVILIDTPEFN